MAEDKTWYSLFLIVNDDQRPFHRLADIDETKTYLIPFPQDKEADFYVGENALGFFFPKENKQYSLPQTNALVIWKVEYHSHYINYNKGGIEEEKAILSPCTDFQWVQIISLQEMNNGPDFKDDRAFLLIKKEKSNGLECCFIPRSVKSDGKLTKDIDELETLFIPNEDIHTIKVSGTGEYISFYKFQADYLGERLETPDSTIIKLLKSQIKHYFNNPGRSFKTEIRETLESLPDRDSILDALQNKYQCDKRGAEEYFSRFLSNLNNYLDGITLPDKFLRRAIDCDDAYREKLIAIVKQEWEENNAALQREIRDREQRKNELVQQETQLQSQIVDLKSSFIALEAQVTEKQKELDSFSEKFKSRINESKKDVAAFLSEFAFLSGALDSPSERAQMHAPHISGGKRISDTTETLEDEDEVLDAVADNLKAVGVTKCVKELARYMLAAYKARIPLIIAGPQCVDFLNAFSAAFTNRSAHIVEAEEHCELSQLPCLDEKGVVGLFNVIGTSLFGPFCRRAGSRAAYACLLADTTEELAIEPRGIYNYALPLFTEFFVEETTENAELTGSLFDIAQSLSVETPDNCALPQYVVSPVAYQNCQRLQCYATKGLEDDKQSRIFGYLAQTLPLMLSLHYHDELFELIKDDNKLNDKDRKMLRQLCGAPDE